MVFAQRLSAGSCGRVTFSNQMVSTSCWFRLPDARTCGCCIWNPVKAVSLFQLTFHTAWRTTAVEKWNGKGRLSPT